MKAVTGRRMAKLAESKGWMLARINGSHHVYTMQGRMERVVIPIHGNKTFKLWRQRSLMNVERHRHFVAPGNRARQAGFLTENSVGMQVGRFRTRRTS